MSEMTYRDALNLALKEEMRRDPSMVVWGEDVALYEGSFKVTRGLLSEFGEERVKDTPISENTIIGVAIGAAMGGLRPVVELMTVNFALLAMDQIIDHMTKIRYMFGGQVNLPMVIRAPGGGGSQLAAQHSQSLETYFMHAPGMYVAVPATPADARGLLKTAIRDNNPVMFLEHELLYNSKGEVPEEPESLRPLRQGRGEAGGEGCHHCRLLAHDGAVAAGGGGAGEGGDLLRSGGPAHPCAAGYGDVRHFGAKDRPGGGGGGVLADLRSGGGDRHPYL